MAETSYSYLTFSITKTPVILRTTDGRPYGKMDLLRGRWHLVERYRDVASVIPYSKPFSELLDTAQYRHLDSRQTVV